MYSGEQVREYICIQIGEGIKVNSGEQGIEYICLGSTGET